MIVNYFALYLLLLMVEQYEGVKTGYQYDSETQAWFRLHVIPATWSDARLRCQLEGGVLASPTSSALTLAMIRKMDTLGVNNVFVGINALISKGDFMDMDGVPLSDIPLRWAYGEPNNANNEEDCLMMTRAGEVADVSCTSPRPYICRKVTDFNNSCGALTDGYVESQTGSCYKFHRASRPWHLAAMTCHTEGGHLAIINSELESQVLKDLCAKNPPANITFGKQDMVIVGFWKWNVHGEWLTIFGETLSAAGYEEWRKDEPNNYGGNEFCGSMFRNGKLNDIPCDMLAPFICEIDPVIFPGEPTNQPTNGQGNLLTK